MRFTLPSAKIAKLGASPSQAGRRRFDPGRPLSKEASGAGLEQRLVDYRLIADAPALGLFLGPRQGLGAEPDRDRLILRGSLRWPAPSRSLGAELLGDRLTRRLGFAGGDTPGLLKG